MPTNVVTPAVLSGIDKSFRTDFNNGRGVAAKLYQSIAMTIPSSAKENVYGWLADLPSISRVAGEYIRKRVQTLGYRLTNETFGGILEVPREAIEDDSYGMFGPMAQMWGNRADQVVDTEFTTLLVNAFGTGAASKDYTGTGFFAANKKAFPKATAFTNVDSGAKKLNAANFEAGLANLQERHDAAGVPMYPAKMPPKPTSSSAPTTAAPPKVSSSSTPSAVAAPTRTSAKPRSSFGLACKRWRKAPRSSTTPTPALG